MDLITDLYDVWYKLYNNTVIQKTLMDQAPKWFKSDRDIGVGDVVFFQKSGDKFGGSSPWTMGNGHGRRGT